MHPLQIAWSPPSAGTGRHKILGTVLARPDGRLLCLVRQAFFGGENQGNTGSPRVETWLALEEPGARSYAPAFVRGTWPPRVLNRRQEPRWSEVSVGEVRMMAGQGGSYYGEALRLSGYTLDDISPGAHPTWPTTIWDRRVILPDDSRFPSVKRATVGKAVAEALASRNRCPEDEVWRVDAFILGLSPKDSQAGLQAPAAPRPLLKTVIRAWLKAKGEPRTRARVASILGCPPGAVRAFLQQETPLPANVLAFARQWHVWGIPLARMVEFWEETHQS